MLYTRFFYPTGKEGDSNISINICHGERLTFLKNKLKQFKNKLYRDLEKKEAQKVKQVISILIRNIDYVKPKDTRFKLNKSRSTNYLE